MDDSKTSLVMHYYCIKTFVVDAFGEIKFNGRKNFMVRQLVK